MPETITPNADLPIVLFKLGEELDRAFITAALVERAEEKNPYKPPRRHWRSRFAIAIAVAATLLIGIGFIVGFERDGQSVGVTQALADVAHRIDVSPNPNPNQFEYTRSVSSNTNIIQSGVDFRGREFETFVVTRPHEQSAWLSATREGAIVSKAGKPTFPTPEDANRGEAYFEALDYFQNAQKFGTDAAQRKKILDKIIAFNRSLGQDSYSTPEDNDTLSSAVTPSGGTYIGNELLSQEQVAKFPREPQALYARVRKGVEKQVAKDEKLYATLPERDREAVAGNPDADEEMWEMLSGIQYFGRPPIPKDLRAAMVRALGELPGVRFDGEAEDLYGRKGDLFVWDHEGKRNTVLFDRDTAVLLSASSVVADPSELTWQPLRHLPEGTVLSNYQMIDQKTVDEVPAEAKVVRMPGMRAAGR
jgi:hypothetical protein